MRLLTGAIIAALVNIVAATAEFPPGLEARVQHYWARRQAKDLVGAYPFYCEAYRSRVSQTAFTQLTRLNRFDLTDVKVSATVPDRDRFQVTITYRFKAPMVPADSLTGQATDAWKRDTDGKWCKEDEPLVLPFPPTGRQGLTAPGHR